MYLKHQKNSIFFLILLPFHLTLKKCETSQTESDTQHDILKQLTCMVKVW